MSTIIITGANGFIGRELMFHFYNKGNTIIALSRQKPDSLPSDIAFFPYDLSGHVPEEAFKNADFIIHTAFQIYSKTTKNSSEINYSGTKNLLDLSRKYKLKKFVYFSTFSAHPGAHSQYGISKREIETLFDAQCDLILKPGLVLGKGGLFHAIRQLIATRNIIPVFAGGTQRVQTVLIDDLAKIIETAFEKNISGTFPVGHPESLSMKELNQAIAKLEAKQIRFLSIPYWLGFLLLTFTNMLGIKLPVSKENIRGLKYGITYDTSILSNVFGIELHNCTESLKKLV